MGEAGNRLEMDGQVTTWDDVKEMSLEELEDLMVRIENDIASINIQINEAKTTAAAYDEYSDPDWYQAARTARIYRERFRQRLGPEIKRRRKEFNMRNHPYGHYFIEAAKESLTRTEVGELFERANVLQEIDKLKENSDE